MTTDYERFRDESPENANLLAMEELILEVDELLCQLHECALAEDRVRGRHRRMASIGGPENDFCAVCSDSLGLGIRYPCPTLNDIIGEVPRG